MGEEHIVRVIFLESFIFALGLLQILVSQDEVVFKFTRDEYSSSVGEFDVHIFMCLESRELAYFLGRLSSIVSTY